MTLSIQNDAGSEGTGGGDVVAPMQVQVDLGLITQDLNIGQGATTGDLITVTYTGNAVTAPAQRISTLANTDFQVNAGKPDIIILGTGPNFGWIDQFANVQVICGNGLTIAPNTVNNPTGSIYILYDTTNGNGGGILVRAPGGSMDQSTYNTPTPGPVVLFHELSHSLRRATNTQQADDEVPAIQDENVLRPLIPVGLRDTNPPHDGRAPSCGGPPGNQGTCCVVASIATGSPYSSEVNALRTIRDGVLRRSDVGFDFFDHLHHDYYAFSPEVCRMMARCHGLQERVRRYFVVPLSRVLQLAHQYATLGVDAAGLGEAFESGVRGTETASLQRAEIDEARALLGTLRTPDAAMPPELMELARYVGDAARVSPFVGWALLDPIEIYSRGLLWRLDGLPPFEVGRRLAAAFDTWAAMMPLTDVWTGLSRPGMLRELKFIASVIARSPETRVALGRRLAALLGADPEQLAILQAAGFLPASEVAP